MLQPLPHSGDLLAAIRQALGAERLPVVIGIDGRQGAGKSSLASWLAWQLEVPAVHLDLYLVHDSAPLDWRYGDLGQVLAAARAKGRPIIVEGICLCQALLEVDRDPDFLVWLENEGGPEHGPEEPTDEYVQEFDPAMNADFVLRWKQS